MAGRGITYGVNYKRSDLYNINIQIEKQLQNYVGEGWPQRVVEETLSAQGINFRVELDLLIAANETVGELNQRYRGVDGPTDVLAFALTERGPGEDSFIMPPDHIVHLGEVVISYPQARRQAEEYGHSVEQELALLIIHGVLHLLGYEHDKLEDEEEMRALEEKILGQVRS